MLPGPISVSRQTTVLVAADPDSLSGKAKKARALAVPVVSETAFLAALDGIGATTSTADRRVARDPGQDLAYEII